jgi:uncharacterized protein DUF397
MNTSLLTSRAGKQPKLKTYPGVACYNSLVTSEARDRARHDAAPDSSPVSWRKSSWSTYNNGCVGVGALRSGVVGVRDTKAADDSPVLSFSEASWSAFLAHIRNGEFRFDA